MFLTRLLVTTLFVSCAAVASGDEIELAYESGQYAEVLGKLENRGLEGDIEAQGMAGMMHLMGSRLYGEQVATDPERAARWLRAAAVNGSVQAQFVLAQLYAEGIGVPQDSERAARWLTLVQLAAPLNQFTISQAEH